ncbi:thioredoxin domain-containing protein [uncultured Draconibacterium sp.]|uniref:DsbA family protein n=1 Tax=uncultured Draconibacterium sp. TaxID=1573823 RepID=UPI003216BF7F
MKFLLAELVLIILLLSCKQNMYQHEIASLNGSMILYSDVDSIASSKIYNTRKEVLKTIIRTKILEQESLKRNLTQEQLVQLEIRNKAQKVSLSDYDNYLLSHNLHKDSVNKTNVMSYLGAQKIKERQNVYADSLIDQSDLKIFLKSQYPNHVKIDEIKYINMSPPNANIVYLISDYDCPNCRILEPKVEELIKAYSNDVNFRFVFFSDYISNKALAVNALSKQMNINEFHSFLFQVSPNVPDETLFEFIENIDADLFQFKEDMKSSITLKELLKTKQYLLRNKIFSTPTFVINDLILDDEFAIYQLEDILRNEMY